MTPEQKQKLIEAYKKADSEYDAAHNYDPHDQNTHWLWGKVEGMMVLLEILGIIDPETWSVIE